MGSYTETLSIHLYCHILFVKSYKHLSGKSKFTDVKIRRKRIVNEYFRKFQASKSNTIVTPPVSESEIETFFFKRVHRYEIKYFIIRAKMSRMYSLLIIR